MHQWNCEIREVKDETPIEVGKSKEGLNILDFSWFGPIQNSFDFIDVHRKSVRR
jgi:hypothetical protein